MLLTAQTCTEDEASCSHIAERVLTCGDIGTAASKLKTEFAPLQDCFDFDDELWWHGGGCNDVENRSVTERESSKHLKVRNILRTVLQPFPPPQSTNLCFRNTPILMLQARITAAKLWLEQQSEQIVFLYGHSVFWKAFFAQEEHLRNCEYRVVHW